MLMNKNKNICTRFTIVNFQLFSLTGPWHLCCSNPERVLYFVLHIWHMQKYFALSSPSFGCSCFICQVNDSFWQKSLPHSMHAKGRASVWHVTKCFVSLLICPNAFAQCGHLFSSSMGTL